MSNITLTCNSKINCYECKKQCEGFKKYLESFKPKKFISWD